MTRHEEVTDIEQFDEPVTETETEKPSRQLIVGGHIRPEPDIQISQDRHGRDVVNSETHFSPQAVHFAVDPSTGIVYAGTSENAALGIDEESEEE